MSAIASTPQQQILHLVETAVIKENDFTSLNSNIESKLIGKIPRARQEELQPEVDRMDPLYKKALEGLQECLKTQYDLGAKVIQQIKATEEADLNTLLQFFMAFDTAMKPRLNLFKEREKEVADFEKKISSLLPANSIVFAFPPTIVLAPPEH